ncbi:phosphatase PAP2 family protein [Chloroflexota bacterium]
MESLLQWGINFIIGIQQIQSPVVDYVFRTITFMGEEEFYLLLLPLIFWCIDFGLGVRLTIIFLLSSWLNINLKDLFQQPHPFDLDQSVMIASVNGYGLPSNHAQSAVIVWGSIGLWAHKSWFWVVAILLMILIGFSRVYLGVHFPTDVLAGWAIGAFLLGLFVLAGSAIGRRFIQSNLWLQLVLTLAVPIVLLFVHPVSSTTSALGTLAGAGVGLVLTHRYISFNARGLWWYRAIRFIIGSIVVFALYLGLKAAFPGEESSLYVAFRFIRYGLIGVWVTLGAPWLFRKLRLAGVS